jgi:hypothetical protein
MLLGMLLALPAAATAQTVLNGYFVEAGGLVVMEAESIGAFPDDWKNAAIASPPNLDTSNGQPTGGDFLTWEGSQYFNNPGVSVLVYRVQINNAGTYRFRWRSQTGLGTNTTEHNDTWVRIEGDAFYGEKNNGSIVCPKGYDPAQNDCTGGIPNGGGGNGWFKVYTSGARSWNWNARTSDNDGHEIYARFDAPGVYELKLAARSSYHLIDRMVLVSDAYGGNETSTSIPESEFIPGSPPPAMPDNPLTVDASGQWFERQRTGEPVFMAGVGGPEGFLFETDARKQEIVDDLVTQEVNALYFHSIRSFEGDGHSFEDPFVVNEDVTSAVDTAVLDNWRFYLDQLDQAGIISWFHILDDTARPWGCSVPLSNDARRYIESIVLRFRDLDNLVWLAGEEYLMGSCSKAEDDALMRAIAAEIRRHDPVHPIGVHHNNGQSFQFGAPGEPVINVFAQQICGNSAVRNPDGIHDAAERGDWVYVMAECHPWHLQLLHNNDRRMLRLSNWATAMAGGYVLMYNAYECEERGKLCSLDSNANPRSPVDPHDPSNRILADLRRLREFMEASRFNELQPADQRATGATDWVLANDSEGIWIAYSNGTPATLGISSLGDVSLRLRWYNPANGDEVIENRSATDSPFTVPDGFGAEVALFVERTGGTPPPDPDPDPDPDPEPGTGDLILSLVNADTDQIMMALTDGASFGIGQLNIVNWAAAATTVPEGTASMTFSLSGASTHEQTENVAPYALFGDSNGDYAGEVLVLGEYTLVARAHSGAGGGGAVLDSLTVTFSVEDDVIDPGDLLFTNGFEAP